MCPNNPIGTVDLYLVSHHGTDPSGSAGAGARAAAARGDHAERHAQGRHAADVADPQLVARARGPLAAALVVQRRHRAEPGRALHRQRRRTGGDCQHPDRAAPAPRGGGPAAAVPVVHQQVPLARRLRHQRRRRPLFRRQRRPRRRSRRQPLSRQLLPRPRLRRRRSWRSRRAVARADLAAAAAAPRRHTGPAHWIKVSASADGSFTVTNSRNNFSRTTRQLIAFSFQLRCSEAESELADK